jgi:amino acid adenylation domain-containing protein
MNFKPLEPITPNAISDENISSRQNTILSTVHTLLAELLQIAPSEIDVTMPLLEMGADSIVIAQAIRRIENHFGLTFTIRQIFEELNTPDALASYIEKQLPEIALTEPAGLPLTPAADSNKVLSSGTQKITQTAPDTVLERILSQQIQAMSEQTQAMSEQTQAMSQQTQAMSQLMSQQLEVLRGTQSTEKELGKTEQPIDLKNQLENTDNQPSPLPPWRVTEIRAKELSRQQQHHLQALIARYTQKTPKSKQLTQDYRPVLADSRASAGFRLSTKEMLYPIVGKRALGSKTWDVDGNEYIDITMGFGVNLFGHQPTFITEALEKQLKDNMQLGLQTPLAGEVAQLICELTGMERVTFCNSGTEAVMTALRLACTATGRYKIVQFAQSYHGHFDGTLGEPVSSNDPTAIPMTPGVKPNMVADVLVLDYGNPQSLEIIQAHANELAAVLVEPVQSRSPHIQPKAFLQQLRQLTLDAKIPLIFDEMITGFRIHLGGAQAWFGVQADIATYGKIVGGGMPIGVVAGKAAYMDGIDGGFWNYGDASYPQADTTFFAGTFCKHPLAMAASLAVLKEIKKQGPTLQAQLNQRTTRLVEHLNHYFEQENVPIRMVHFGSLFRFSYSGNLDLLYYHLLDKGVYVWEGRNCFLSTAHTDEDIDYLIQAVKDTIKALQEGGFLPPRGDKTLASLMQYEHTTQSVGAGIPLPRVGTRRRIPLTEAQKQLWVLTQLGEEGSLAYHIYASLQLKGVIRLKALHQSVQQVVMRHEALQTVINDDGDFQQCDPSLQTEVHLIDLSEYADQACETEIASFFEQESRTPFDLSQGPLFRVHLLKLTEDRHLLVLTAHHIIVDGLSMNLIIQEIGAFYSAACQGITCQLEPPLPFREYIAWQGQQIQTAEMATQEAYWLDKFSESIPVLNLPTDYPYPPIKSYKGSKQTVRLPAKLCRDLKVLSQKQGCTPFMTFLSAYTIWLYRITGQNDILLGIPVAGKNLPGSDQLVGYCTHLLPIRSHIVGDETVLAYLKTIRGILLEAYQHQDYPFANLINKLNIKRESSHTPLVSATFNLDKLSARPQLFELEVEWYSQPLYFTAFDIGFNLTDIGEQLILDCEYNTDVFNGTTIERFIGQFQVLLEGIVSQPAQSLSQLPLLTEAEQQQLLAWNKTQTDYPKELSIIDLFQAQVEKTPDNIAVVFEEQSVTYQQLNQKANQLAHYLLNLKTNNFSLITDNCLMGICVERSLDMVIGLLGILKAGSAYVPLDPDYPKERLQFMLEDSKVPVLLSQSHLRERLPVSTAIVICLDNDWKKIAAYSEKNPIKQIVPENLAYVIYTSGSTGKPKGVMIEHQALTLHCQAILQQYTLNENDRILQFASFSFDTSLEQLLVAWLSGAGSMLVKSNLIGAQDLLSFLQNHAITVVDLPPAYWQQMLEIETIAKALPALRLLILGGEALLPRLAQQTRSLFPALLCFNAYGPTEAVITPTLYRLPVILPDNTLSVAIGQPRANTRIYILSAQHQPQPIGIPGELCIAGRGLALGYLNRPKLTAEKFVEVELFGKTERIYKTGDLARWLPDGNLEYIGRIDNQVKLRGFRIELGEIEAVLTQHLAVKEAVVILYEANDNKQLVAYLTVATESSLEPTKWKDWLKARLPDYMVPSHFIVLDQLPLTPNGKIDRRALPAPEIENLTGIKPATPTEELLANLWASVLKCETISRHDNFFELGGHSLLATQLIARIRDSFNIELPIRAIFEHPQLSTLAAAIEVASRAVSLPPIERQAANAPQVLSFAQQRLWFLNQLEGNNTATYNMPAILRLAGHLDIDALQQSLHWLLERHSSLRTYFPSESGKATVRIQDIENIEAVRIHDLRHLSASSHSQEVQNWANRHAIMPFDLEQGPLFKADLLLLDEQQSVLLLNMHHIISDGLSWEVFMRDWQHAYTAFVQGEQPSLSPLTIQYSDYAAWQRDWLQGQVLQQQVDYWHQQLKGLPELLALPTDKPRPPQQSYQGAYYSHRLSPTITKQLSLLSQQQGVTLFMTLLTTFYILLSRYSRQDDLCVGTPIAGRTHSQTEDIIGFFVNTLVLRSQLQPQQRFTDLLQATRETCLAAYAHQDIPFEMLVEQLQPTRSLSHSPLFQVMFVLQNQESAELILPGLNLTIQESDHPIAKFDLTLDINEQDGQLYCLWEYATDLFYADMIERMAGHFEVLLTAIVDNPEQSISQLPMLTEKEIQQLQAWNDTATDYPSDKTLVDLFEQIVSKTPDNIAVVFENQQLSYRELNLQSNQLAHYLLNLKNDDNGSLLTDNCLVGICIERSLDMVIGLLGILKAGGAYMPLDPDYPKERLQFMLEDSKVPVLLSQSHLLERLPVSTAIVVCLDNDWKKIAAYSEKNPIKQIVPENLAYVIYTSGSTGKPKGVMIEHQALALHCQAILQQYTLNENDRVLQFASFSFDTSLEQLLVAWLSGAGSMLVKSNLIAAQDLLSFLQNHAITVVDLPPAYWQQMLEIETIAKALPALRLLILGGEALLPRLAQQTRSLFPALLCFNAYGPTEAVITPTLYRLPVILPDNTLSVAIGQPRANTRIYILSAQHQPQPIGIPGELCIAGRGIARGYLNRPEVTAEKFIEVELLGKTERIYKTGDLARWLPDGNLEYLGRIDHQVKLRGFRIELGEIETVLSQHQAVKEAVVILYEANDNKQLVAYLTVATESNVESTELKNWLKARLPDYMVPSHFTVLEQLPLTPNGKIDRQALPTPAIETNTGTQPATPTEDLLASLWASVLKRETINRHDNFFELGGHSLLATQLIARIRDSFQVELPVRAIFEHPQLSHLAKIIETATGSVRLPPIEVQANDSAKVLSFAQQRLWFLNQFEGNNSATYNMPAALQLSGQLDVEALQQSLHWMLERHASLRTCFPIQGGKAQVRILELEGIEVLKIHDLRELTPEWQSKEIQNRANRHAIEPFDLAQGPLFKADLLLLNEQQSVLLVNMHHIISDGWSIGVFIRDWQHAYTAFAQGEQPSLPPLSIQYSDYAAWQRDWLQGDVLQQQVDYWHEQLKGAPELLELPTDKPRPHQQSYQGAYYAHSLSATLTKKVTALSQQQGVSLFMTLLSTFYILLSRYSRLNDLCVGTPIANRTHSQTEDIIGFFVNTLVLRSQVKPEQSVIELLLETRQTCLAAYAHQDIPFEMLVEQLQPSRSLSHSPLFQVMFVLQNNEPAKLTLPNLNISTLESDYPIAKFDLTLNVEEQDGELHCLWEYATDLFYAQTIERMAEHFEILLTTIIDNPAQSISYLPMLTEKEIQQLQAWNETATDYPFEQTLVDLFEQQVEKTPDNIAVVFENQQLSYRELNLQSNQLAHYLLKLETDNGSLITDNCLIAIAVERSLEMVIGLLGILKAGCAYVPIDPNYPAARIRYMLDDSAAPLLLTQSHLKAQLPAFECMVVCLDATEFANQPLVNPDMKPQVTDLAYVIYTSGSTGKPKGVAIEHLSSIQLIHWAHQVFDSAQLGGVLASTSICFDLSIFELFVPLSQGGSVIVVKDALQLQETNETLLPMTLLNTVPSAATALLNADAIPNSVQVINLAGEPLKKDLVQALYKATSAQHIYNLYGPSEDTTYSTFTCVAQDSPEAPTIGKPIANTRIYILDAQHQPQPPGIPGELGIAGYGLARGYLNRPKLTAEKFIEIELFGKTERIYKTGDLARWLPDGNLEYLGRIDSQVKLRGFRIELGEIEAVLSQHQAVNEAVVILSEADDNKQLVAYLTTDAESNGLIMELKDWLKARLPDYMIPSHLTVLAQLPLTPNGKIDRKALSQLSANSYQLLEGDFVAPSTREEKLLAGIWAEVLGLERVGIHNNFFDLGGHSLLLIRVQAKLSALFDQKISVVELFEYPTIHSLAQHLSKKQIQPSIQNRADNRRAGQPSSSDIAIIGMSGRFPGAATIDEFWQNIRDGVESISFFSDEELIASCTEAATLKQPNYVKASGVLSDIELFDANFFDISPREAQITDPQHRLFLECAWESLESAGYALQAGNQIIGVYAGVSMNTYLVNNLYSNSDALEDSYSLLIGNDKDFLPTRVSYKLNLRGPSITVQTACSTSLVAVHLACQSLLNGECDMALAGGVSISLPQKTGYWYQEGMINSPDGHCRAFDANAKGTVGGNGVGVVVLKRLEQALADGDPVHAVIKGSAVNNDGFLKVGYTAPSVEGQTAVISEAQAIAGIDTETISYIEAHGTGTELGDPIEITALTKAFRASTEKKGFCAIGSLKTNIGHTDAAAGVAGLIKTVLALKHQLLPPSLHFEQPNPQIDFAKSPFYVNRTLSEWKSNGIPRRAGVSSFGIGGTNAHVILEEAPALESSEPSRPWQLLVLSAKTPSALDTMTTNLANYLAQHPDINLADVAYTLHCGRQSFKQRRMLVCQKTQEAMTALRTGNPESVFTSLQSIENRAVVFMFSGQGAQYVNMGYELYQTEPLFREQVDHCSDYLKAHLGLELRQILYPSQEHKTEATQQINQTAITQTALFVVEYALAKLWMSYGIQPEAMIGHSIGEYVAACLADVFSLEDALSLVAARGQMMQALPFGAMLAVLLPESAVQPLLHNGLSLAAINHPERCVVSGATEAVESLQNQLTQQGVECRRLQTSHAFHSDMMAPIVAAFTERVKQVKLNAPHIPYVSNVTGTWITSAEATDPNYWAIHLRQTVRFASGLQTVLEDSARILLEVGPGRTLSTLAKQHPNKVAEHLVLSSLRHPQDNPSDVAFLLNTLGQLWLAGGSVDWSGFYTNERRQRLPLPTYPFERQRYWIEPSDNHQATQAESLPIIPKEPMVLHSRSDLLKTDVAPRNQLEQTIADIWSKALGIKQVSVFDNFFELGGDSLLAVQIIPQLRDSLQVELFLHHIIEAPTVNQLATLVKEKRIDSQENVSILVEIQLGDESIPPLFCIHPAGGGVFSYLNLAHYLPKQTIYGIQTPSLVGEQEPPSLIKKATYYIEVIKRVQPKGPYLLAGMSYGGNMAVEMAIQLQQQGESIALVALFDSYPPISYENQFEDNWSFLSAFLAASELMLGFQSPDILNDELKKRSEDEQWQYILEHIDKLLPEDMVPDEMPKLFNIWKTHHGELRDHVSQIYQGNITLFKAIEKLPHELDRRLNMAIDDALILEGWRQLSSESIEYIKVPGNHGTMLDEPHVHILAEILRSLIKKALAMQTNN